MKNVIFVLLCIAICTPVLSQNIDFGVGYGNTYFTAPEKYANSISNLGYGFIDSHPMLATLRYSLLNKPFSFSISTVYQKLSGHGFLPVAFVDNSNLLPGEVDNKSSLWLLSFGTEWLHRKSKGSPFLVLEFVLSKMNDISISQGFPSGNFYNQQKGGIQSGLALGAGVNFPIAYGTTLRFGAKYILHGIFIRPANEKRINSIQLIALASFPIYTIASE